MAAIGARGKAIVRRSRRIASMATVLILFVGVLASSPTPVSAAGSTVAAEDGTLVRVKTWFPVSGIQDISNNATAGTFTLWFDGAGPTGPLAHDAPADGTQESVRISNDATGGTFTLSDGVDTTLPIAFNADAATIETRLETDIGAITAITAGGSGTAGDPWVMRYDIPFKIPFADLIADDTSLLGNTTITIDVQGQRGVKSELEKFPNILNVSVSKPTTQSWRVTFVDRSAPAMTYADNLMGGSTTVTVANRGMSVPIDPAGIAWMSGIDQLLVADSEINEEELFFDRVNVWEMNRDGEFPQPTYVGISPDTTVIPNLEPTGLAYDPTTGYAYFTNDNLRKVTVIDINGHYDHDSGDDVVVPLGFSVSSFPDMDLEDIAIDPAGGRLFLAGGSGDRTKVDSPKGTRPRNIYTTNLDGTGMTYFDASKFDASGLPVATVAEAAFVITDIEGIAYRASSGTLLITDASNEALYELTTDGYLLREIDVYSAIGCVAGNPCGAVLADVALAPRSDGSAGTSMYVVDRAKDPGEDSSDKPPIDGKLYELTAPFANLAPFVDAGPSQMTDSLTVSLDGTAFDDGQPLGGLTTTWSKVSGSGPVSFSAANAVDSTVTFAGGGEFVLQLSATDGVNPPSVDTVTITVDQPPAPDTFTDDDGNPHEANIEAIAALGITEGCNPPLNDKFCPERNVTRAEMAVFLVQSMGEADNLPIYQGYFSDVAAGAWYTPWVERLFQLGVTVGFPDGSYHPDATVTRGEMAVFLVTAFDHTDKLVPPTGVFGDVDLAAFYADDAELIKRLGITAGCSTDPLNYCPNNPVRRDHMATFLAKALGL